MRIKRKEKDSPTIFTESMADISFLLIIFFMVSMVFAATKGLDFHQSDEPPTERDLVNPEESVDVHVLGDGSLLVDRKSMAIDELLPYIHSKLVQDAKKPVILRTDPEAPYSAMIIVFDQLRRAPELANFEIANIAIPTLAESAGW